MDFPIKVETRGTEEVQVTGPTFAFTVCAHGARALAAALTSAAEKQYCDGYRHGDESTMYLGPKPEPASTVPEEELLQLCHRAMREDRAALLLVRGYATGMLQLADQIREWLGDRGTFSEIELRLIQLCLPGTWMGHAMQKLRRRGVSLESVYAQVDPGYCEHGRSTASTCAACEEMPGVGLIDLLEEEED